VVRIAIGKKVFRFACEVTFVFKNSYLEVRYKKGHRHSARNNGRSSSIDDKVVTHTIDLAEDLEELKFYLHKCDAEFEETDIDDCEVTHFLAMCVKKSWKNSLDSFTNSYSPEGDVLGKKYLVIEFRSENEFNGMRQAMLKDRTIAAFFSDESRLNADQAKKYCKALTDDSTAEKMLRVSISSPSKAKLGILAGKGEHEVLLVYPFGADAKVIDNAAIGLHELGCVLAAESSSSTSADITEEESDRKAKTEACQADAVKPDSSSEKENEAEDQNGKAKDDPGDESRAVLEFSVATFERLEPGVYLNDTLIDFWCQW
jgi:hypothetical protein